MHKNFRRLIFVVISLVLLLSGAVSTPGYAQVKEGIWSVPVNLSHTGSTTNPKMVVDSDGVIHAIWTDAFAGTLYSFNKDGKWSTPYQVSLPFGKENVRLFSTPVGLIYAFWIDSRGILFYSSVFSASFGNAKQWSPAKLLADSTVEFDLAVDSQGVLNLAYIFNLDTAGYPAGVYYQQMSAGSTNWTAPVLLYQSSYFRGITADLANVKVAVTQKGQASSIYIVWDNRLRKQVFLNKSLDSGYTWDSPVEISRPVADSENTSPFYIRVGAIGDQVVLIWQDGDPKLNCNHYFQLSHDSGKSWGDRQQFMLNLNGCELAGQVYANGADSFLLETEINKNIYLLLLNQNEWSTSYLQNSLADFTNPETFNTVNFDCMQFAFQRDQGRLLVVGCDSNRSLSAASFNPAESTDETGVGDIWFQSRPLGKVEEWFPKQSSWKSPSLLAGNIKQISSPSLVTDSYENVYAFWIQPNTGTAPQESNGSAGKDFIYFARWNGERWSQPAPILSSPEGSTGQPSAAIDDKGRLLVVWSGGSSGEIYFSEADSAQATSAGDWSAVQQLPKIRTGSMSPDIVISDDGSISVAYAVPFNEGRGIYIIQSNDNGRTWTDPRLVFDGAAAGWEMVDSPKITNAANGSLHVIWTRSDIVAGAGSQALYYANSLDGGRSWSDARQVSNGVLLWNGILATVNGEIHRFWQEETTGRTIIWHQFSTDNGANWSNPSSISSYHKAIGSININTDAAGGAHLFLLDDEGGGLYSLLHYTWQNLAWTKGEQLSLASKSYRNVDDLAAVVSQSGIMTVVFSATQNSSINADLQQELLFTNQVIDLSAQPLPTTSNKTPSPQATISPTVISSPISGMEMTPTTANLPASNSNNQSSQNQPFQWLIVAGVILVVSGLVIGYILIRKRGIV